MGRLICGDVLQEIFNLPNVRTVFADPPDNMGAKYHDFVDEWTLDRDYLAWLKDVVFAASCKAEVVWLSYNARWDFQLKGILSTLCEIDDWDKRTFLWRFTFGQHQEKDCGNGYRPILRLSRPGVQWNTDAIRIPSARQEKYGDKRANPKGRVPDDFWEFPRVCGTFKERRKWHPNQHPEALIERIVKMSGGPVIDMFGGTFTVDRVCRRLGIDCTSIEISPYYVEQYQKELANG